MGKLKGSGNDLAKQYKNWSGNSIMADLLCKGACYCAPAIVPIYNQAIQIQHSNLLSAKQGALSEREAATITKFWKQQKNKVRQQLLQLLGHQHDTDPVIHVIAFLFQIHQHLIESNMWGSHLESFSWRIDVKTKARHLDQLNQPTAIMELKLKSNLEEKVPILIPCSPITVY